VKLIYALNETGHSSQVLTAAAILCEIAKCSIATWAQNDSCMKMKWPPSQNSIRDRKSTFSVEKTERSFLASRHYDTFKRTVLPSAKHRLMVENKIDFARTNGREPVKWSMSGELDGASPRKLERDHVRINPRPLHGNSMRKSGLMQSPIRVEKVYDNHQKLGEETLKTSNVGFRESYIKDWNRGRSKRV